MSSESVTADLRALAGKLQMLKPCECVDGCDRCLCAEMADRERLPSEAEVRTAIFEAGVHTIEVTETDAGFAGIRFGGDMNYRVQVRNEEVETGTSSLLALLRALEAARG